MLRNREIRRFARWFVALSGLLAAAGFGVNAAAGWFALASSLALGAAFFVFTKARYLRIARLSEQVDLVLHHADRLYADEAEEGELSVLQSEIAKMTLRVREQNDALKREKERLADSLADVAHQLRTPLTSVSLILSLLENDPQPDERRALCKQAEELLARMDWLLSALLKLSRLDAGIVVFQNAPVAVAKLARRALEPLLIPMELRHTALTVDIPAGAVVTGDVGWLSEALQNILKNAMESAGENGRVALACTDNPLYTEISVHDSGAGFAREDLPRLFDRFYRGNRAGSGGYGIGLALCRTILRRQGGTITAKNHPQGGALFILRFPK